jgi:hypothetical protein
VQHHTPFVALHAAAAAHGRAAGTGAAGLALAAHARARAGAAALGTHARAGTLTAHARAGALPLTGTLVQVLAGLAVLSAETSTRIMMAAGATSVCMRLQLVPLRQHWRSQPPCRIRLPRAGRTVSSFATTLCPAHRTSGRSLQLLLFR